MADDITIKGTGNQNAGDLNPVIDLRNAGAAQGAGAAVSTGTTTAGAGTTAAAGQQIGTVPQRRSNAILLGDEEATQTAAQEKYAIPALVKEKFPDLIQLIKETESMNQEERDYWFQIMPIMTEDQIKKFRDILVNEKTQLTNLDKEYEQELAKLNEKHMIEWKEFETKEKRKSIATAEQASKDKEKTDEEELLKRLSQV